MAGWHYRFLDHACWTPPVALPRFSLALSGCIFGALPQVEITVANATFSLFFNQILVGVKISSKSLIILILTTIDRFDSINYLYMVN